jgi:hypothetical protein
MEGQLLHCHYLCALSAVKLVLHVQVRSGVRAVPQRTGEGAPPLLGKLPHSCNDTADTERWLFTGLGVRGLLLHADMGHALAEAVVNNSEAALPATVLRWQA